MTSIKTTLFIFGILFIISCGQTDSSSNTAADSKQTEQIANSNSDAADNMTSNADNMEPKAALIAESMDSEGMPEKQDNIVKEVKKETPKTVTTKKENKPKKTSKQDKEVIKQPEAIKVETNAKAKMEEEVVDVAVQVKSEIKNTPKVEKVKKEKKAAPVFSHDVFDKLLKKNVSARGKVNYNNLKAEEAKLDGYLKALDANPPASGWSKSKKMAYWINAYNAATIKLILKNYPVSSITKLHGGKPWDHKWIPLGGKTYTLNNIENDILRPVYKDARIHFAVNCAAKSCPPLLNRAWTEGNLNSYLEKQTKAFINDPSQNTISADAVEISKIFEWYSADFGNIITYLNKYSNVKIKPGAKVTYKDYNWSLNK